VNAPVAAIGEPRPDVCWHNTYDTVLAREWLETLTAGGIEDCCSQGLVLTT